MSSSRSSTASSRGIRQKLYARARAVGLKYEEDWPTAELKAKVLEAESDKDYQLDDVDHQAALRRYEEARDRYLEFLKTGPNARCVCGHTTRFSAARIKTQYRLPQMPGNLPCQSGDGQLEAAIATQSANAPRQEEAGSVESYFRLKIYTNIQESSMTENENKVPPPTGLLGFFKRLTKGVGGRIGMGVLCAILAGAIKDAPAIWNGIRWLCACIGKLGDPEASRKINTLLDKGNEVASAPVVTPVLTPAVTPIPRTGTRARTAQDHRRQAEAEGAGGRRARQRGRRQRRREGQGEGR